MRSPRSFGSGGSCRSRDCFRRARQRTTATGHVQSSDASEFPPAEPSRPVGAPGAPGRFWTADFSFQRGHQRHGSGESDARRFGSREGTTLATISRRRRTAQRRDQGRRHRWHGTTDARLDRIESGSRCRRGNRHVSGRLRVATAPSNDHATHWDAPLRSPTTYWQRRSDDPRPGERYRSPVVPPTSWSEAGRRGKDPGAPARSRPPQTCWRHHTCPVAPEHPGRGAPAPDQGQVMGQRRPPRGAGGGPERPGHRHAFVRRRVRAGPWRPLPRRAGAPAGDTPAQQPRSLGP
jgi:hypothetical protein